MRTKKIPLLPTLIVVTIASIVLSATFNPVAYAQLSRDQLVEIHDVRLAYSELHPSLKIGLGIDRQSRYDFKAKSYSIYRDIDTGKKSNISITDWEISELTDEESVTHSIAMSFRASLGITKGSGAIELARKWLRRGSVVRAVYERSSALLTLPLNPDIYLDTLELSRIDNLPVDRARKEFLRKYGTHAITTVYGGSRLELLAHVESTDETVRAGLTAAVKALVQGELSAEHERTLRNSRTQLRINIVGSLDEASAKMIAIGGYSQINMFLENFRNRQVNLKDAPMGMKLESYANLIPEKYRTIHSMFVSGSETSDVLYKSLPAGSVIAWLPGPRDIVYRDSIEVIVPPSGWRLMDEADGRFLQGTNNAQEILQIGGSTSHSHEMSGPNLTSNNEIRGDPNAASSGHTHSIHTSVHLPPFVRVVFIVKVYESSFTPMRVSD